MTKSNNSHYEENKFKHKTLKEWKECKQCQAEYQSNLLDSRSMLFK